MTISDTLKQASATLRAASIPTDLLDAQTLLAHALACDRTHLIVHFNQQLDTEKLSNFQGLLERRVAGEPLQYITGHQEFFGLDYARTLAEWNARFQARWAEIEPLGFDARFKRMWEFYLAYCEAGFRSGATDVTQVALVRP